MNKRLFKFTLLCFLTSMVVAQDTLCMMTYNILNYSGNNTNKTRYLDLRNVVAFAKPDIFICSELVDSVGAQLLLDSAFNKAGIHPFSRAGFRDGTDTDNMLFYNNQKIKLKSQFQISTSLRDISHYRIYYISPPNDTIYLNVFSAHLKAGNQTSDENQRFAEAQTLCSYLGTMSLPKNIIVGGDFNLYYSSEPAFALMTSSSCGKKLNDPINATGIWNSAGYSYLHTQSTRTNTFPGCCGGSTGGLDDRFDFLLTSNDLLSGVNKAQYLTGTYQAFGNDGQHYNKALTELPAHPSIPSNVIQSLFNISDHLPVTMKILVGSTVGWNENKTITELASLKWINSNEPEFVLESFEPLNGDYEIRDINGSMVGSGLLNLSAGRNFIKPDCSHLCKGLYFFTARFKQGNLITKFVK